MAMVGGMIMTEQIFNRARIGEILGEFFDLKLMFYNCVKKGAFGRFIGLCDLGFGCVGVESPTQRRCFGSGATPYKKQSREFGGIYAVLLGVILPVAIRLIRCYIQPHAKQIMVRAFHKYPFRICSVCDFHTLRWNHKLRVSGGKLERKFASPFTPKQEHAHAS